MAPVDSTGVSIAAALKWHCKHCNQKHTNKVSISLSIYLKIKKYSIYLHINFVFILYYFLSIYQSYYLCIYVSIYLCIYLSIYLSITLSIYLSIYLSRMIVVTMNITIFHRLSFTIQKQVIRDMNR